MNEIKKVVQIWRVPAAEIRKFDRMSNNRVDFEPDVMPAELKIKVPGELEISSKIENKVRMYTAKLTFSVYGSHYDTGHYLYMVGLADESVMAIGSNDKPFPVEDVSQKLASSHDASELIKVTVSYKSHLPIAEM